MNPPSVAKRLSTVVNLSTSSFFDIFAFKVNSQSNVVTQSNTVSNLAFVL